MNVEEFKDWISLLSDFTWPVVIGLVLIFYRGAFEHFLIAIIDLIFRRK